MVLALELECDYFKALWMVLLPSAIFKLPFFLNGVCNCLLWRRKASEEFTLVESWVRTWREFQEQMPLFDLVVISPFYAVPKVQHTGVSIPTRKPNWTN